MYLFMETTDVLQYWRLHVQNLLAIHFPLSRMGFRRGHPHPGTHGVVVLFVIVKPMHVRIVLHSFQYRPGGQIAEKRKYKSHSEIGYYLTDG